MSTRLVGWALRDAPSAHPDLSTGARLLLVYLADHFNEDEGAAWPSHARLAGLMGCSDRAIRKWLDELKNTGVLEVESRKDNGRSNVYRIAPKVGTTFRGGRNDVPTRSERRSGGVGTTFLRTNKEPIKEPAASPETAQAAIQQIKAQLKRKGA